MNKHTHMWINIMKHIRVGVKTEWSIQFAHKTSNEKWQYGVCVCRLCTSVYVIYMDKVRCNKRNTSQQYQNNVYEFISAKVVSIFSRQYKMKRIYIKIDFSFFFSKMKNIPQYKRFLLLFCTAPQHFCRQPSWRGWMKYFIVLTKMWVETTNDETINIKKINRFSL